MASSDESQSMIHGHKGKLVIKGNQVKEFPQLAWYLAACGQCPIVPRDDCANVPVDVVEGLERADSV